MPAAPCHPPSPTLQHTRRALLPAAVLALAACGGGGGGPAPDTGGPSAEPSEVGGPPPIVLAEPRNLYRDNRLTFAWASDGFTGSIFARVEFGFSYSPGMGWTLQHNGPGATYVESSVASFELRYRDGYFLMTAQNDSDNNAGDGYGIDVYPGGVTPYSPLYQCIDGGPCANNIDFFAWDSFPRTAGETLSLLIPRADPLNLRYAIAVQPAADRGFATVAENVTGLSGSATRGIAWKYDFPTARARVSGCDADGGCTTSESQPLERALVDGVDRLRTDGHIENAEVALSGDGSRLFAPGIHYSGSIVSSVRVFYRGEDRRWQGGESILTASEGLRRRFAPSSTGRRVAVEFGICGDAVAVCDDGFVVVYDSGSGPFSTPWAVDGRFPGLGRPQLSDDGQRLAGIRAGQAVVFVRGSDGWQERPVAAGSAPAVDVDLSDDGSTVAVAHGAQQAACGCREVSVHLQDGDGWRETGRFRAAVPGGPEGTETDDGFGGGSPSAHALALNANGTVLAVGAAGDDLAGTGSDAGAVYLFRAAAPGAAWQRENVLRARGAAGGDRAGQRVALNAQGNRLVVGARGLASHAEGVWRNHAADAPLPAALPDGTLAGAAAYVFEYGVDCVWAQRTAILAPTSGDGVFERYFGLAIDAAADTVVLATGRPAAADAIDPARAVFTY
jgi:hypothetical protein